MLPIISKKTLRQLGLSDTQIKIYFSVLQNPGISILNLAKNTGLNRQQIYNDTDKLIDIGLIDKTKKDGRTFIPAEPKKLLQIAKNKLEDARESVDEIAEALPNLEKIKGSFSTNMNVRFYEGIKQIQDVYENELLYVKNLEVLSFVGSLDEVFNYFPEEYWKKWNKTFVKNGSSSRMLVNTSAAAEASSVLDKEYNRKTRQVIGLNMLVNIDVFANIVLMVSFQDKTAIWIESKVVADSYRALFETMWRSSE